MVVLIYGMDDLVMRSDVVFFQAKGGKRDLVRSRGLGDVYKRQAYISSAVLQMRNHFPGKEKIMQIRLEPPQMLAGCAENRLTFFI